MKFYSHYSSIGFSNCYLINPEEGDEAILIDPGIFDVKLLELIEKDKLYVRHILVTHAHKSHIDGIKTLKKVYDATIYSYRTSILDGIPTQRLVDGEKLKLGKIQFEIMLIPGHSNDSLVFKVGRCLFTGDVLTAGNIGSTSDIFTHIQLIGTIKEKLFTLQGDYIIFPGHGPPTTLAVEKRYNPHLIKKTDVPLYSKTS